MKHLAAILAALAPAGCADSSGVHRIDSDTFTVTVEASPVKGGIVAARRAAYDALRHI